MTKKDYVKLADTVFWLIVKNRRSELYGDMAYLTAWLHSSITFPYYLDEAVKEYGQADNVLMAAQYMAIDEIFSEVINLIKEGVDND